MPLNRKKQFVEVLENVLMVDKAEETKTLGKSSGRVKLDRWY